MLEWTSSGPKSNLEGRLVRGGRSVTVDVHGGDVCPCFSEQELKDRIRIIREIAAGVEEGTTAEDLEVRIRLNGADELEGRFEVKAIPDEFPIEDTFTAATVNPSDCSATFFIDDMDLVDISEDIDRGEAQACLAEMLKAFAKEQQ